MPKVTEGNASDGGRAGFLGSPHIQAIAALDQHGGAKTLGLWWDRLVVILLVGIIIAILSGVYLLGKKVAKEPLGSGRTWLDYGPLWMVALGIVASLLGFLVVVLAFVVRAATLALTDVLALLAALFGIIGTLVGTYFGIRTSLETHEGLLKLAQSSGNAQAPIVKVVKPLEGGQVDDKRPPVTATFSKAMAAATINAATFTLANVDADPPTQIAGKVDYDPSRWMATLAPEADLNSGTYQATVTTDVKDEGGTALPSAHTWKFTVS